MKKPALITFLLISIFLISPLLGEVFAQETIIQREQWNADDSLVTEDTREIGGVDKILVTGITTTNTTLRTNTDYWLRGLYYFFATKTQFNDIPFDYLVGWDGSIYEGAMNDGSKLAPVKDQNAILIGYLSNYDDATVTELGKSALERLLVFVTNDKAISAANIATVDWTVVPTDDLQKSLISTSNPTKNRDLANKIDSIRSTVAGAYSPKQKTYRAEILSVTVPDKLEINETYDIRIKVKNTGDSPWFKGSADEITVAKADGRTSLLSINDVWLSTSQTAALNEQIVGAGKETELIFQIKTPLTNQSTITENFVLKTRSGSAVEGSAFELKLNVDTSSVEIVEVLSTPTNYLNIRETPSLSGKLIDQASPGERFIVLERQSGWVKLDLGNSAYGWATGQYLRRI